MVAWVYISPGLSMQRGHLSETMQNMSPRLFENRRLQRGYDLFKMPCLDRWVCSLACPFLIDAPLVLYLSLLSPPGLWG